MCVSCMVFEERVGVCVGRDGKGLRGVTRICVRRESVSSMVSTHETTEREGEREREREMCVCMTFSAIVWTRMDVCVSADQVYMAKLAEQAERYDEMVKFMDSVVKDVIPEQELTVEERNLLSVAYKNVIGARRASWRIISSIEQKEESKGNVDNAERIKGYKTKVGGVVDICVCVCVCVFVSMRASDACEGMDCFSPCVCVCTPLP